MTTQSFRDRKHDHIAESKVRSNPFMDALREHGKGAFRWQILFVSSDPKVLADKEIELIAEHNTLVPNGYNTQKGGWVTPTGGQRDDTVLPKRSRIQNS
jgi:hypothetical protein